MSAPPEAEAAVAPEAAATATEAPMEVREVAPGVFAVLQPARRRFADSNAAVLVSDAGAVVIDAPQNVGTATWLHERAAELSEGPARDLVTTHWHLDHALGPTVLRQRAEAEGITPRCFGHAGLAERLRAEGTEQLEEHRAALPGWLERGEAMREAGTKADGTPLSDDERELLERELLQIREQRDAVAGLELRPPTHPIERQQQVELGSLAYELIPVRAHTDADLLVYVPQARVLISGDVLDELPFGGHGYPRSWLAVLQQLAALEVETIVPGHGAPMRPEAFERAIALWSAVIEQADQAVSLEQGADERYAQWSQTAGFEALRESLVGDEVSGRAFDAFVPESLARAVAEARGELEPLAGPGSIGGLLP